MKILYFSTPRNLDHDMMSFFFIPASKLAKVDKIKPKASEVIIDFEDAILEKERDSLFREFLQLKNRSELWCRIPVRNAFSDPIDLEFLKDFLHVGTKKIIIPKLKSSQEWEALEEVLKNFPYVEIILLVEHPRLLIELGSILKNNLPKGMIKGLGLGSHDLMTYMKSEHTPEHIHVPRLQILYLAKAYDKLALDIASMELKNRDSFNQELYFGKEYGFDAKFFIHPKQLEWHETLPVKTEQLKWAKKIIKALPKGYEGKEIEPFVLEGKIIEKPHVEQALELLKKKKNDE